MSLARTSLVAALMIFAIACDDGNDSNNGAPNQPPRFNNTVFSLAVPPGGGGDVYVGGDFTSYNGAQAIRIVHLKNDSTIDPSFLTGVGFNGSVRTIVLLGNQSPSIYVGGDFTTYNGIQKIRIARLSTNGSLDPAFLMGTGFDNTVYVIAPTDNGGVYVAGAFTSYNGIQANSLVRLKADGTVDPTFVTGIGFNGPIFTIMPDGNGDLYVGGAFTTYKGVQANRFVRLNIDGSLDATFLTGTGFDNTVQSIAPADNNGLYVGGAFTDYNGTSAHGLVRLNSTGVINPLLATGTGFDNTVFHVVPAGDATGNLYIAGAFTTYNGSQANQLIRLRQNGTIDSTFATGTGFGETVFRVSPVGDGSGDVYAGGQFVQYQSSPSGRFVRLTSTGVLILSDQFSGSSVLPTTQRLSARTSHRSDHLAFR